MTVMTRRSAHGLGLHCVSCFTDKEQECWPHQTMYCLSIGLKEFQKPKLVSSIAKSLKHDTVDFGGRNLCSKTKFHSSGVRNYKEN